MKIEIKCRFSGSVLFSHDAEENNLRITLQAAVTARANLTGAYLAGANLDGAYLTGAYLTGAYLARANLARANLAGANLDCANLAGANLAGANLAGANLDGANLAGANLARANLDGEELTKAPLSLLNLRWAVLITSGYLRIGCQRHSHADWLAFSDTEIEDMEEGALDFWRTWKAPLMAMCAAHRSEVTE